MNAFFNTVYRILICSEVWSCSHCCHIHVPRPDLHLQSRNPLFLLLFLLKGSWLCGAGHRSVTLTVTSSLNQTASQSNPNYSLSSERRETFCPLEATQQIPVCLQHKPQLCFPSSEGRTTHIHFYKLISCWSSSRTPPALFYKMFSQDWEGF